ncbi:unnamed protein product [Closterium sp. Naga37s-1]|nr:unnamed protein product [Closterium sp. Naga37s-1]
MTSESTQEPGSGYSHAPFLRLGPSLPHVFFLSSPSPIRASVCPFPHPTLSSQNPLSRHQRTASLPPTPLPCVVSPTSSLQLEKDPGQGPSYDPPLLHCFSYRTLQQAAGFFNASLQLGKARALLSPSLPAAGPPPLHRFSYRELQQAAGYFNAALQLDKARRVEGLPPTRLLCGASPTASNSRQQAHGQPSSGPPPLRRFSYRELQQAAGYFNASLQLGKGSFGTVFRGQVDEWLGELPRGSKREVAVKVLHTESVKAFDDCLVREGGDRRGEDGSMGLGKGEVWVAVKVLHTERVKAFDDCLVQILLMLGILKPPKPAAAASPTHPHTDCSAALLSLTPPFLFLFSPTRVPIPLPLPPPQAEILVLGDLRHPNLVQLLGYCMEDSRAILVYELLERGDLHHWLHPNSE